MVSGSDVVITICQELQDTVTGMGHGGRAILIENVMGGDVEEPPTLTGEEIRRRWQLPADAPLVLYTGTFEAYQGLDMLLEAAARLQTTHPAARVLVVGGSEAQVVPARARAAELGADHGGLRRPAAGPGDSRLRGRGDGAGLAAHPRHQHAAEDLLVPALRRADRRHQPADAYAGADRPRSPGWRRPRPSPSRPPSAGCSTIRRRDGRWRRPPAACRTPSTAARSTSGAPPKRPAGWPDAAAARRRPRPCRSPPRSEGAGHRRNRFHRRPPGGRAGPPRARGAGAGPRAEPRALSRLGRGRRRGGGRRSAISARPPPSTPRAATSRSSTTSPPPTAKPASPMRPIAWSTSTDPERAGGRPSTGRPARRALLDRRCARAHRPSARQRGRAVQSR